MLMAGEEVLTNDQIPRATETGDQDDHRRRRRMGHMTRHIEMKRTSTETDKAEQVI